MTQPGCVSNIAMLGPSAVSKLPSGAVAPFLLSPMIRFMLMKVRTRISKGGQISIPVAVRRRWGTSTVALDDQGNRLVIEPAPDDPIDAVEGSLAGEFGRIDVAALRRLAREDARAAEDRRAQ
jgi:bifunctional DNA-binding transcriptional regulator/antitoxin component of YhaV-PrlF toxin-antitoxin module